jgi:hypothetical protein
MSYIVTSTSGVRIATIADGTINASSTSLTLIGKNYAGYGLFLNDNYVRLLENFANASAPLHSRSGQLWYDSTANILKLYNGTTWKPISSTAASSSSPVSPVTGDLWWDTTNSQLKVRGGSAWITIGPSYTATAGTSGTIVETILDNNSISHVIVKFYISNSVIAILSKDSEFTPQVSITGFDTIKPGLNLISSSTLTGAQFTGNASNATTLNGVSSYLRSDINTTATGVLTAAGNLVVGTDLTIASGIGSVSLTNSTNNSDMNLWVKKAGVNTKAIGINGATAAVTLPGNFITQGTASITGNISITGYSLHQGITIASNKILPNANNTIDIGATATKFANIHASTLVGNVTGNVTATNITASAYIKTAVYATTTARDLAIPSPTPGMQVFVTSGAKFYGYTGVAWVALN